MATLNPKTKVFTHMTDVQAIKFNLNMNKQYKKKRKKTLFNPSDETLACRSINSARSSIFSSF